MCDGGRSVAGACTVAASGCAMVGVVLQARLQSSRFPRKILQKIGTLTIVEHCMRALQRVRAERYILATNSESYGVLAQYARVHCFDTIIGPDDDVLARFVTAARIYDLTTIVRATADNPFVSAHYAQKALSHFHSGRYDYFHYTDLPLGGGVELFSNAALITANTHAATRYEREHVTPYIYAHPHIFKVAHARALKNNCQWMRITIDTATDYRAMQRLFARCKSTHKARMDLDAVIAGYADVCTEHISPAHIDHSAMSDSSTIPTNYTEARTHQSPSVHAASGEIAANYVALNG